jgi:hypothetical protein
MNKMIRGAITASCTVATAVSLCWSGMATGQDKGILYGVRGVKDQLTLRLLDLGSMQGVQEKGSLPRPAQQRLVAIFQNPDRGVGLVSTVTGPRAEQRSVVRMVGIPEHLMDASSHKLAGIPTAYAISSIIVPRSGVPLALLARHTDTPPFWLFRVDLDTGAMKAIDVALSGRTRYEHLTQCPAGAIYAVAVSPEWGTRLVQLDIDRLSVTAVAKLRLDSSDHFFLQDLACGPSGTLYGLADVDHSGINSLLRVDSMTGKMTPVQKFDVERMMFIR